MTNCKLLSLAVATLCFISCVNIDYTIGSDMIPKDQSFKTYAIEVPISTIYMEMLDSLSGVSSTRMTIGAIRDKDFGLTTRATAVSLVPFYQEMDFGDAGTQEFKQFTFRVALDTLSVNNEDQSYILQNVNVYELSKPITNQTNTNSKIEYDSSQRVSKGVPILNGKAELSFEFSEAFGNKYMHISKDDLKDIDTFLSKYPGIYMDTDVPDGEGGRINMLDLQLEFNNSYISSNVAELKFSAKYSGVQKDTSFLFFLGMDDFHQPDTLLTTYSIGYLPQTCLNVTGHSDISRSRAGLAGEEIIIEGGGGLHPVIPAADLRQMMIDAIAPYGDPNEAVINKATVVLPFEPVEEYSQVNHFPKILSPGVKIHYSADSLKFFVLSDYSSKNQDAGDINMSLFEYAPDFTYHAQTLLRLKDPDQLANYDLWFLIQAQETVYAQSSQMDSETAELYQQMMYSSYYNSMYNGYGYGGYGGYNNYNTYYYYYMMQQMQMLQQMQENTVSYTTTVMLDKDRYYNARLLGPKNKTGRVPVFKFVFSVPEQ